MDKGMAVAVLRTVSVGDDFFVFMAVCKRFVKRNSCFFCFFVNKIIFNKILRITKTFIYFCNSK